MSKDAEVFSLGEFDLNHLTLGEICELEDYTGSSLDTMFSSFSGGKKGQPQGKILVAIAWLMRRREDPSFTLEDAKNLRIEFGSSEEVQRQAIDKARESGMAPEQIEHLESLLAKGQTTDG